MFPPVIRVLDLVSGHLRVELGPLVRGTGADQAPVVNLNALAFSPDGASLASGEERGLIRFWDLAKGAELSQLVLIGDGTLQAPGTLGARRGASAYELVGSSLTSLSFVDKNTLAAGADDLSTSVLRLTGPGSAELLGRHDPPGWASGFRTLVVSAQRAGVIARAGRVTDRSPDGERPIRVFEALTGDALD